MFATSDEMERDKLNEFTTREGQVCAVATVALMHGFKFVCGWSYCVSFPAPPTSPNAMEK